MFKVGDWVQVINNPEIVFQIEEFHYNGIVIHDGLLIEERFLKSYNPDICPICGKPEVDENKQPQPGTHIITVLYECGTELDFPLGSDEYIISKRCDEPQDSWFPDEVDYKLEGIINDRYNVHYHTVDNTTGMCVTCGKNVDKTETEEKYTNRTCSNCKYISTKCDIFKNNYKYLLETRGLEISKNKWTCGLWEKCKNEFS